MIEKEGHLLHISLVVLRVNLIINMYTIVVIIMINLVVFQKVITAHP